MISYLFQEMQEGVLKSYGVGSVFAEEVDAFGREMGLEGEMVGGLEGKEREWTKLRRIGEGDTPRTILPPSAHSA